MGPHQPVASVAVEHKAVVGVLAVSPEVHGVDKVPRVHLALAGAMGQVDRQKVGIVAVIPATDGLPELARGILVGVYFVLVPGPIARLHNPHVGLIWVVVLAGLLM